MFPMYDTPFHFVALEKSGIKSVKDLAGKKSGIGPRAGTCGTYFPLMFKALGIDTTIRNGQGSDMAANLQDGLIDAFPFCAGVPIAAYSELETTNKVRFFTFTDDEIKKLKAGVARAVRFGDSQRHLQAADRRSQDGRSLQFRDREQGRARRPGVCRGKAVLENNPQMVKGHAAAKETLLENWNRNGFLPFHPGAIRYFKEKGINVPEHLIPPSQG